MNIPITENLIAAMFSKVYNLSEEIKIMVETSQNTSSEQSQMIVNKINNLENIIQQIMLKQYDKIELIEDKLNNIIVEMSNKKIT